MDNQEVKAAINDLKSLDKSLEKPSEGFEMWRDFDISIPLAISALEKQIAKKPIPKIFEDGYAGCPSCKNKLFNNQPYCDRCGKKLDWSVEE